jgi:DNA-binding XRE family transcriptional regulator
MRKEFFKESELAALAKKFRKLTGKNQTAAAKDFKVHRATISYAEEKPEQSLTNLRIRMIEQYSENKIVGPLFQMKKK